MMAISKILLTQIGYTTKEEPEIIKFIYFDLDDYVTAAGALTQIKRDKALIHKSLKVTNWYGKKY